MANLFTLKVDTLELPEQLEFETFDCLVTLCVIADDPNWGYTTRVEFTLVQVNRSRATLSTHAKNSTDHKFQLLFEVNLSELLFFSAEEK
jgi:hypothetical protein